MSLLVAAVFTPFIRYFVRPMYHRVPSLLPATRPLLSLPPSRTLDHSLCSLYYLVWHTTHPQPITPSMQNIFPLSPHSVFSLTSRLDPLHPTNASIPLSENGFNPRHFLHQCPRRMYSCFVLTLSSFNRLRCANITRAASRAELKPSNEI
ncbi:hypothetical protein K491DRAFT_371463 [Lophiostoma macrostomum CBS 122681]|uniref:Uncharacterized protein n=1 Tax=Lophiostoma macrostomum CBS 122681 TaxID=1314788 RepID=A0A6A6TC54_9PLEO|nr:hypothetical protein K491DRAFT_371463 [Lophiostoma macrostomum CBS 122681]